MVKVKIGYLDWLIHIYHSMSLRRFSHSNSVLDFLVAGQSLRFKCSRDLICATETGVGWRTYSRLSEKGWALTL